MLKSNIAFRLFLQKEMRKSPQGFTLLGIDYGTKFLGLSITDTTLKQAYVCILQMNLLETIESKGDLRTHTNPAALKKLQQHIQKENVKGFVIGSTNFHRFFDKRIIEFISKVDPNIPYTMVDESYTTSASKEIIQEIEYLRDPNAKTKKFKDLGDGVASMLILQIFLDSYNTR